MTGRRSRLSQALLDIPLWHFVWIAIALSALLSLFLSQLIHGRITWDYPFAASLIALAVASLIIALIQRLRQQLVDREARLRLALTAARMGIWDWNIRSNEVIWSENVKLIFGFFQKSFAGTYEAYLMLVHPEDRDMLARSISACMEASREYNIEHRTVWPDGTIHWLACKGDVFRDAEGKPVRMLGTVMDITERKRAEEALRTSEARYRQLIELSQDAIFELDDQGTFTLTNPAGCTLWGYTEQELVGMSVVNTYLAEERPAVAERLQQLKMGELLRYERVGVRKNGTTVPVEVSVSPMTHRRYQAVVRDITERKRVEAELLALKDDLATELMAMSRLHDFSTRLVATTELQSLLDEVLTATMALQDADFGKVQLYNLHTQALEIVAHRGFQQDFLKYFNSVYGSSAACGRALQQQARVIIEDVQTDPRFEPHRPIAASAGFRAVQSTPLFSRSGEALGIISTHFRHAHRPSERELRLTDLYARQAAEMIERKRGEEALRDSEQRLRQALEDRERLSQDLHDHVIQSIYAIGMALESCQYLIEKEPGLAAQRVQRSIADLNGVMTEVRNYIEWTSPALTSSDQLREALEDLVRTIPSARPLAIRLEIDPSTVGQLTAEEATHVLQIAREAVSNSLRHSGAKTGAVSLCKTDGGLRLEVRDDGVGFDIKSGEGHGLGLRNMAARASTLNANLRVLSERGRGTQIILDIPKEHDHAPGPSAIDPAAAR